LGGGFSYGHGQFLVVVRRLVDCSKGVRLAGRGAIGEFRG
jgi:hypothetical protein